MKIKTKKVLSYLATAAVSLFLGVFMVALLLRPQALEIGTVDLSSVSDGEYLGICQNKLLFAVVKVQVQDHKITDIEVLEHKASYMEQANQIANAVCSKQSLEVDAITGATFTSDTIRKAIENAFNQDHTSSEGK